MESTAHAAPASAPAVSAGAPAVAHEETRHIAPRTYVIVFGWLTIMTALEVAVTAMGLDESVRIPVLVVIAIIKALLVILFYMHLRYDSRWFWFPLIVPLGFVLLLAKYLPLPQLH